MNKFITSGIFLLTFALALPTLSLAQTTTLPGDYTTQSTSSCTTLSNNLRYHSTDAQTGGDVSSLQAYLQLKGYLSSDPTGYFGLLTQGAVQKFQSDNSLYAGGYVGPLTRAKINAVSCSGSNTTTTTTPTTTTQPTTSTTTCPPQYVCTPVTQPTTAVPSTQTTTTTQSLLSIDTPNGGSYQSGSPILVGWEENYNISSVAASIIDAVSGKQYYQGSLGSGTHGKNTSNLVTTTNLPAGNYTLSICDLNTPNPVATFKPLCASSSFSITATQSTNPPSIGSLSQSVASVGDTVTVGGANFNPSSNLGILIDGSISSIKALNISSNSFSFVVPSSLSAGSHTIQVAQPGYASTNPVTLIVAASASTTAVGVPTITSITPSTFQIGTTAIITGTNLSNLNSSAITSVSANMSGSFNWTPISDTSISVNFSPQIYSWISAGQYKLNVGNAAGISNQYPITLTPITSSPTCTQSPSTTQAPSLTTTTDGKPSITVVTPNGGETLCMGQVYHIVWNSANVNSVTLGYSYGAGSLNSLKDNTAQGIPNTGSYDWNVNIGNGVSGGQIKFYILGYSSNGQVQAYSSNYFTVSK